jgi:hypothetical protein
MDWLTGKNSSRRTGGPLPVCPRWYAPMAALSAITGGKVKTYLEWRIVGTPSLRRAESTKSQVRGLPNFLAAGNGADSR